MASCHRYQCVYISDCRNNVIHKVCGKNQITQWPVNDEPEGLSVTSSSNVLVTCYLVRKIKEFTTDGKLLREISLQSDIVKPWHSVELTDDQFVVCHGGRGDKLNRVCVVDSDGNVLNSYGGAQGPADGLLNYPFRLIVTNGLILVSDSDNNRVLMLSPSFRFVRHILSRPIEPSRMCFDEVTGRLYVADCKLENVSRRCSCVNVYSFCE